MTTDLLLRRSAIISANGLYRYELRRTWDKNLPPYVAGYLNPSVADHEIDDPTIVRTHRRADSLGCGEVIVWNLGAGRATDPVDWLKMVDPIGPENDDHIRRILTECKARNGVAVVGWGAMGGARNRDRIVLRIAAEVGIEFKCLGVTKFGQPRHPLYIANAQPLADWPVRKPTTL
jgi:hypothetical protein